jgi:hypothetical protein
LAALYVLVFGPKLVGMIVGTAPSLPAGMTALFMVFMTGYALGWWNRLWGGVVIVLASVLMILPYVVFQFQGSLEAAAIFGSPVFGVGALYLLLHREEVRTKRFIAEPEPPSSH